MTLITSLPRSYFTDDDSQSSTIPANDDVHHDSVHAHGKLMIVRQMETRKRKLRFNLDNNLEHPVPHRSDLTENDMKEIWYDRFDFQAIKQTLIPVIRKMMRDEPLDEAMEETSRGLEYRTREGATRRQRNKLQAIHAVLAEGIYNVELLSSVYCRFSAHCKDEARNLGHHDEVAARIITRDVECLRYIQTVVMDDEERDDDICEEKHFFSSGFARFRVTRSLINDIKALTLDRRSIITGKAA
jgi:hypothetical protein